MYWGVEKQETSFAERLTRQNAYYSFPPFVLLTESIERMI